MSDFDDDEPIELDPADMALNESGAETTTPDSPAEEIKTTDESKDTGSEGQPNDGEEKPEGDPKAEEDDSKGKTRPDKQERLNERFSKLTGTLKQKDETIEQLERELAQATREKPELKRDENGEVTIENLLEYNEKVADQKADDKVSVLEKRLEGEQVATRFDQETAESLKTHKMLDPDSPEFNPKVATAVEKLILKEISPHLMAKNVKALSKISIKAIIDDYMEGVHAAAEAARGKTQENLQHLKGTNSGAFEAGKPQKIEEKDPFMKGFDSEEI